MVKLVVSEVQIFHAPCFSCASVLFMKRYGFYQTMCFFCGDALFMKKHSFLRARSCFSKVTFSYCIA